MIHVISMTRQMRSTGVVQAIGGVLLMMGSGCSLSVIAPDSSDVSITRTGKSAGSIASKTAGLDRLDGLITVHLDREAGKVWLELPPPESGSDVVGRFLYVEGLATGLGSNPIGLDRGQIGGTRLVVMRRIGNRLLVEAPNLSFRAMSDNPDERKAVRESFATSILWAGEIETVESDGRSLVDFTSFVVRDAHNVAARLKRSNQGSFTLDKDRSVLDAGGCLAFPDNVEFEAILTFASKNPGSHVRATAPAAQSVTLVQHHSLVRLPDGAYRPRRFDPRAPSFGVTFRDYSASLAEPLETRWISRHRLEKTNVQAPRSTVKEPIVYYVDGGAPEPVRSALIEGASWWSEAFEAAGFVDAFRVEVLPKGAHPLDVRYNVIQWVHRSTRGWSYGNAVTDPRTGEIIKGHVSLGSLRVRQDRLLFEGLAGTDATGSGSPDDPIQLALSRIRQLAAHEVGHTLGFTHNFAASTYGDRASVMDYPAPRIGITAADSLDFSDAYAVGMGDWDRFGVKYAYSQFRSDQDEAVELNRMVEASIAGGLLFMSDADARPSGAAHPLANLWDNGTDPIEALDHALNVRRIALSQFGANRVREGMPLALLHEVFVPVYLHHRYQLEAAVKTIGGLDYAYAVRGDGRDAAKPLGAESQRRALDVVLRCMSPDALDIPEPVIAMLFPRPFGHRTHRELFKGKTNPSFDAVGAASTAADLAVRGLLNSERCARLVDQHRRDDAQLGLGDMLDRLVATAFSGGASPARLKELQHATQQVVVSRLIELSARQATPPAVRSRADLALENIRAMLLVRNDGNSHFLIQEIGRFLDRPMQSAPRSPTPTPAPPGSPIGTGAFGLCACSMSN